MAVQLLSQLSRPIGRPLMCSFCTPSPPLIRFRLAVRVCPRRIHMFADSVLQVVLLLPEDIVSMCFSPDSAGPASKPSLMILSHSGNIWRIPADLHTSQYPHHVPGLNARGRKRPLPPDPDNLPGEEAVGEAVDDSQPASSASTVQISSGSSSPSLSIGTSLEVEREQQARLQSLLIQHQAGLQASTLLAVSSLLSQPWASVPGACQLSSGACQISGGGDGACLLVARRGRAPTLLHSSQPLHNLCFKPNGGRRAACVLLLPGPWAEALEARARGEGGAHSRRESAGPSRHQPPSPLPHQQLGREVEPHAHQHWLEGRCVALQGNMDGTVHAWEVSETVRAREGVVLLDLEQPVVSMLALSTRESNRANNKEPAGGEVEGVLVVGEGGRVVLATIEAADDMYAPKFEVSHSWRVHGQVSSTCLVGGQWLAFVADRVAWVARVRTSEEGAWSYPAQLTPSPLAAMESVCSLAPAGPDCVAVLSWQGRVMVTRVSAQPSCAGAAASTRARALLASLSHLHACQQRLSSAHHPTRAQLAQLAEVLPLSRSVMTDNAVQVSVRAWRVEVRNATPYVLERNSWTLQLVVQPAWPTSTSPGTRSICIPLPTLGPGAAQKFDIAPAAAATSARSIVGVQRVRVFLCFHPASSLSVCSSLSRAGAGGARRPAPYAMLVCNQLVDAAAASLRPKALETSTSVRSEQRISGGDKDNATLRLAVACKSHTGARLMRQLFPRVPTTPDKDHESAPAADAPCRLDAAVFQTLLSDTGGCLHVRCTPSPSSSNLCNVALQSSDVEILVQLHQGMLSRLWTSIAQLSPNQANFSKYKSLHSASTLEDFTTRLFTLQRHFVAVQDAVDSCSRLISLANSACWRQCAALVPLVADRLAMLQRILFELFKQMRDMPCTVFTEFAVKSNGC